MKHLIYFWQGRDSSVVSDFIEISLKNQVDKGTSAYLTVELDDELGREAPQVKFR